MSALYNLQKHVMGGFADFIPHGTMVDLNSTSSLIQPDDDPIENWTDANLGDVLEVSFDTDKQEDEIHVPSASGDYVKETEYRVYADYIDLKLKSHNDLIFQLLFGLNNKLTGATGQQVFENRGDRSITGWVRLRGKARGGTDIVLTKIEVKLSLKEYPGWTKDTTYPVVRFEVIDNALNDMIDTDILAA